MACALGRKGVQVQLIVRKPAVVEEINANRTNPYYQKGLLLPDTVSATLDPTEAFDGCDFIFHAVPVQFSRATLEKVGRLAGADPESYWWWITDEALDAIAAELNSANYCVLDRFLGSKGAKALRKEVRRVRTTGHLKLSRLAGGRSGANVTYSHTAVSYTHLTLPTKA